METEGKDNNNKVNKDDGADKDDKMDKMDKDDEDIIYYGCLNETKVFCSFYFSNANS